MIADILSATALAVLWTLILIVIIYASVELTEPEDKTP